MSNAAGDEAARPALSAVVLAAGRGERMGGPKVRLVLPSGPLVAAHVERLARAGASPIVVATRVDCRADVAARVELSPYSPHLHVLGVDTPEPAITLARALSAVPPGAIVIITPVDNAPVDPSTILELVAAVVAGAAAATPTYAGRGGHPVVCRREVLLQSYAGANASAPPPLRDVLAALGEKRARCAVDDPAVAVRLDTPAELAAAFGTSPTFF